MNKKIYVLTLTSFLLITLTGCFELIEDLSLNDNGSGTYKLTLNLSASKVKVKSVMALDSLNGEKIPSMLTIEGKLDEFKNRLLKQDGLRNISVSADFDQLIYRFSCDFSSLNVLHKGIENVIDQMEQNKKKPNSIEEWFVLKDNVLERKAIKLPEKWKSKIQEDEDYHQLKEGKCVFITRTPTSIQSVKPSTIKVAKNNKATMLQVTPHQLLKQPDLLTYTIHWQ